jgi:NAD+ synthase/NAD+ synthase (glutamine-hydrolysing)
MLSAMARKHRVPVLYVNQVGGNDDLVFDGRSFAVDAEGRLGARARAFVEDLLVVDQMAEHGTIAADDFRPEAEIWQALVLGTRDHVRKCGFSRVLLGLSGGIDSSLTAAIAVEAMGPKNVLGVLLPSPYSSPDSVQDAHQLAFHLGIQTIVLRIDEIMHIYETTLHEAFTGRDSDVTEENIQARIRGNLLMALSNKFASLLLTTGNKSELAVGYCTIYGDMCGGLAVISDVPKSMVYRLAQYSNRRGTVIPSRVLAKAPSAELRPNQTDQDSLPSYDLLDQILERHIEQHQSALQIVKEGFDESIVEDVLHRVRLAEFKRKQSVPGIKVTDRAFGSGWRMPVACKEAKQESVLLHETRQGRVL